MPSLHPLNQAVVAEVLYNFHNGQLRHCRSMGFGTRELGAMQQPEITALLAHTQVPWCSVSVNRNAFWRLVNRVRDANREAIRVERMLRLGASTDMVNQFHGLSHQEVALRRDIIGLPKRKGRYPVLREEQETTLWKQWRLAVEKRDIALIDDDAMLTLAMDLAETLPLPLSVIWAAIHRWIGEGLV